MKKYVLMLIFGFLATLLLVATKWCNDSWDIACNIIAMLGSGVFCSAIVSMIIELNNKKRDKIRKQEQSDYIFSALSNRLFIIVKYELGYFSEYLLLGQNCKKTKQTKKTLTISNAVDEIVKCLETILSSSDIINCYSDEGMLIIDKSFLETIEKRNKLAYDNTLSYYQLISKTILKIIEDSNFYFISGVIDKSQSDILLSLQSEIEDIIAFSNESNIALLLEFKKIFFESLRSVFVSFNIDSSKEEIFRLRIEQK